MSHDTDTDTNATPDRGERIQRLRQAMRHPKILAADGWYTQEDDRIAPTDREYIAACDPATISELLSELDELWRIAGAYRPQKELADALKKSKSSRADAMNRLNAEQAKRITLQHHAADLAQSVADLTAERDALVARLAEIEAQEPVAWVRYRCDGGIQGPLLDEQVEPVRRAFWTPLIAAEWANRDARPTPATELRRERDEQEAKEAAEHQAAEIARLRAENEAWREQCDTLTHQVICCGVAASHPDATLTTRGAYAGKWNSAQAEEVRKLRAERDEARAELAQAREVLRSVEWTEMPAYYGTVTRCPLCGYLESEGHAPDCKMSAALAARRSER